MKKRTRTSYTVEATKDRVLIDAIRETGIRETARRTGLSPSAVSAFIRGSLALPDWRLDSIRHAVGLRRAKR